MGKEAYKIWCRMILKNVFKNEFYIMIAANFDEIEDSEINRHKFGRAIDDVLNLLSTDIISEERGRKIDDIFRRHMPQDIFRNEIHK